MIVFVAFISMIYQCYHVELTFVFVHSQRFYANLNLEKQTSNSVIANKYDAICKSIEDLTRDSIKIHQLQNSVRMLELIAERIPEGVLHLIFLLASFQFKRLRILLSYSLQKTFNGILPTEFIFIIIYGVTFIGIIKGLINKRYSYV